MKNENMISEIDFLKEKRNAVILAHNYQSGSIQAIADFVGDSLELARISAGLKEEIVVFAGVKFMAETTKILAPEKTVLIPDANALCPMASMISKQKIRQLRERYPDAAFVAYVNTTAEVKAEVDITCTSANAVRIVNSLKEKRVVFLPDKHLAAYVQKHTDKEIIPVDGYCPVHDGLSIDMLEYKRSSNPEAKVIIHPESPMELIESSDEVASTGGMVSYVKKMNEGAVIVGTEKNMINRLKKENPHLRYIPLSNNAICVNMAKITLEKILISLRDNVYKVDVPNAIRDKARLAIERMLAVR